MSMQDPISDMLTCIRNAQAVSKKEVCVPWSGFKTRILKVLEDEGYIVGYKKEKGEDGHPVLFITLKYYKGKPVIDMLKRVSRPGLRVYKTKDDLPQVKNGLGIAIISTSKQGVISDQFARQHGVGGEVICYIS